MAKIRHLENKYTLASFKLINKCDANELRFYLYLKLYAINKHSAFPTYDTIQKDLGWSRSRISRTIQEMCDRRHLRVIKGKKGQASIYDITWYDEINSREIQSQNATETGLETLPKVGSETRLQLLESNNYKKETIIGVNADNYTNPKPLIDFYFRTCLLIRGFEPEISGGKLGTLLKQKLQRYSHQRMENFIIYWLSNSLNNPDLGVMLSSHAFNRILEKERSQDFYQALERWSPAIYGKNEKYEELKKQFVQT